MMVSWSDTSDEQPHWSRSTLFLCALAIAWIVPGLFGREPWKPDEGYSIGLINHMAATGDWVVPHLTGEPFVEKPPLFYICAAAFARVFSPWPLQLHESAMLAVFMFMSLTFLFVYRAGKEWGGACMGAAAVLGLLGCLGMPVRAHYAITDVALWCGFAIAIYGVSLAGRRHVAGAFWLGTGAGVAFMSKGFVGPSFLGPALVLLPLFGTDCRKWRYPEMLGMALLFSLPWLLLWPLALHARSPELFAEWFWDNNIGRFLGPAFGFPALAQTGSSWKYGILFLWFSLPLWPAAVWRHGRGRPRPDAFAAYLSLTVAIALVLLSLASGKRELYFIPVLIPLTLLAASGERRLPAAGAGALVYISLVAAAIALALLWIVWLGWSCGFSRFARAATLLCSGAPHTGWLSAIAALGYSAGWVWLMRDGVCARRDWILSWAAGVTAVWGVAVLLFMPVLDYRSGYRRTFAEMVRHLPANVSLIESSHLGESQRAIIEYYFGLRTRRIDAVGEAPGEGYLLVQELWRRYAYSPGGDWEELWRGARPGDNREAYVLYRKREGR